MVSYTGKYGVQVKTWMLTAWGSTILVFKKLALSPSHFQDDQEKKE